MNKNVWIAGIVAILAPMVLTAQEWSHKKPSPLDDAEIKREADLLVKRLNAPSPRVAELERLGDSLDKFQALDKQSPGSPKIKAQFKHAVRDLLPPLSPVLLTRSVSASSPKMRPLAVKAIAVH